jgi:hypothetical protein
LHRSGDTSTFPFAGDLRYCATKEVDDVDKAYTTSTPATGVSGSMSAFVATEHSAWTAPIATAQGTALSVAGTSAAAALAPVAPAQVAVAGARSTDLPGSPARGAPV